MAKTKDPVKDFITRHLRDMGDQLIEVENDDGSASSISRAELLARRMWDMALGWVERKPIIADDGTIQGYKHTLHSPNQSMVRHISDRIEGRPSTQKAEESEERRARKVPTHERVGDQRRKRLDKLAGKIDGTGSSSTTARKTGKGKASPKIPIPPLRPRSTRLDNGTVDSKGPGKESGMARKDPSRLGR